MDVDLTTKKQVKQLYQMKKDSNFQEEILNIFWVPEPARRQPEVQLL
jgi:hypothetical protein